jgi:bacillolysin
MKKYCILIALLSVIASRPVFGQHAFDAKKHQNVTVNTSSLNARKIDPPKQTSPGRIVPGKFQQDRTFSVVKGPHRVIARDGAHPTFIETRRDAGAFTITPIKDARSGSYDYLQELEPVLGTEASANTFTIQRIQKDPELNSHVRMQQTYKGIPIHGAEVIVHLNATGQGMAFNGKYVAIAGDVDIVPGLEISSAIGKVKSDIASRNALRPLSFAERKFVQHADPQAALCIYEDKALIKSYLLAYHIVYSPSLHKRYEYFIDAHTGNVLHQFNTVCTADGPKTTTANDVNGVSRTVNTYQVGANFFMIDASRSMYDAGNSVLPDDPVGGVLTIDMNNTFGDNAAFAHVSTTTNVWSTANHAKAVSAHFNAGQAFEYYKTNHARTSINGQGGTIISIINVSDPDNGQAMDNAFWNGKAMFYGNGNTAFKPLAGAMDVAGHELTHGVVENTANLEYQGESGAINESMADVFGSMMDPADWLIGEDVVKLTAFPSGALRSMSDPHNGGTSLASPGFQPKHMNEKFTGTQDNGGVHVNSGIPNHAFFKYAEAITRDKAAKVFYRALDNYLTKSSQFIDLRLAVIKAATDLFGAGSAEVTQAGLAFDAVGITNGQGGDFDEELPANPGTEFLLVYSTDTNDPNSFYRSPISLTNPVALTTSSAVSRPSITDDGSFAVFVASDKTIHAIVTAPGEDPQEFVIQEEGIWSNVAISKGGNRMAAVTESWDNKIYVYDFVTETWGEFELYNPTYSGEHSGGTVYADALEWDYTGEFIVYDCWNQLENASGNNIEYWDVNFIHAWDVENEVLGDGSISKLFSSLPEGVSIGNATFSKLSPNILAFDMVDELNGTMAVLGSNIETGETDVIFENNTLGYPSFNKNDTRIAFTLDAGVEDYYTGFVTLNANKISSSATTETDIFSDSKWAVYFSAGDRDIGDEVTAVETKKLKIACYPNPFSGALVVDFNSELAGKTRIRITNLFGQRMFQKNFTETESVRLELDFLPPGVYVVHLQNGLKSGSYRVIKSQ